MGQKNSKNSDKQEQPSEHNNSPAVSLPPRSSPPRAQAVNEGQNQELDDEMTANDQENAEEHQNKGKRPSTAPSIHGEITSSIETRPSTSPLMSPANSGSSFDFSQRGSTMTQEFEKRYKNYQQIVSNGEAIEFNLCKLVIIGLPRAGKTSLKRRLLGEPLLEQSPSTPVAESPQKAIIHRLEEDKTLMCRTAGEKVCILKMSGLSDEASFWLSQVSNQHSAMHELAAICPSRDESKMFVSHELNSAAQLKELLRDATEKSTISSIGTCGSAIQLNIIDTGGQPEFQDILPLFVNGPAVYILVFKANEDIKKHNNIVYESEDKQKQTIYQTNLSTEEVILKSIATIQSFAVHEDKYQGIHVGGGSPVILVATHCNAKYGLSEEERSFQIEELNKKLMQSYKDFIGMHDKDRIIKIDNLTSEEDEFVQLKAYLMDVIEQRKFAVKLPPQWLALYSLLQQGDKSHMSIRDVEVLANSLNINNDDLKTALWILHHCAGCLMYFEEVEELRDTLFLDIQQIFDCVTALIAETFDARKITDTNLIMTFKDTGKFKVEDIEWILKKRRKKCMHGIDLKKIICLLKHLHILTETKDGFYFLPCVLKSTEHQLPSAMEIDKEPPMLIRLNTGINPNGSDYPFGLNTFGLFFSMIIHLINVHHWELVACDDGKYYRNKITFRIGSDEDKITIIDCLQHFEVRAFPTADTARQAGKFHHSTVREAIEEAIKNVCMSHIANFSSDDLRVGFYCTCCGGPVHCIYFRPGKDDMNTKRIYCNLKGLTTLSQYQRKWLEDAEKLVIAKEECTKNKEVLQGTENGCTSISRPSPNAESTGTVSNDTVDSARQDAVAIGSPLSGGPCAQYTRNNPEPQEITSFGTETITEVQNVCFRSMYADLQSQLNPDDISANLYSAGLLSEKEHDEVNIIMQAIHTRVTTLLSAVERAIHIDPKNFSTFLDILDKTPKYRPITSQAREKLGLQPVGTSVDPIREESTKNKEVHQGTENYCTSISRPSPNADNTGTASNDIVGNASQDTVAGSSQQGNILLQRATAAITAQGGIPQIVAIPSEPQEIISCGTETITEVQSAAINTLYDATPVTENRGKVTEASMTKNTTKSENERAQNALKKCRRDLLNVNFDLIYHALNTLIKPTKVKELKRLSRPEEKNQWILEAVEKAIEDEVMFKKFLKILEEPGRANKRLIEKLQKYFNEQ